MLLAVIASPAAAQRLDGCPAEEQGSRMIDAPSGEAMDQRLQDAGIALSRDALTAALGDRRADVRSLAALKLGRTGNLSTLTPLMQAWLAENDPCTKLSMEFGLGTLVPAFALDKSQHPDGQPWVKPFQGCTESDRPPVKISIEQVRRDGPTVRISARNLTDRTLPFVMGYPEQLYSVTVLGPGGTPAQILEERETMFKPGRDMRHVVSQGPTFVALPPNAEAPVWTWNVADDFDMSVPGVYQVRLGGRIAFLNSAICSNTALVTVP